MGFGRIGGLIRSATNILHTAQNIAQKPLSVATRPLDNLVGKFLDKLGPFGQALKPLMQQFLSNPGSLLTSGGLTLMNNSLKAAPAMARVTNVVNTASSAIGGLAGLKQSSPAALQNLVEMVAHRQAQLLE